MDKSRLGSLLSTLVAQDSKCTLNLECERRVSVRDYKPSSGWEKFYEQKYIIYILLGLRGIN